MKTENELIGPLLETTRGLSRNGECLYPECPESPGRSHVIAESVLRKRLAQQSKVLIWDPKGSTLTKNARSGEDVERIYDKLRERGVEEVTWPLFCSTHDCSVFRPLETKEVEPDAEQATLLAYRALCYKTYAPRLEEGLELLLSLENPEKAAENMRLFAIKPSLDARKRVESMVVASDYGQLKSKPILIPIAPCVACTDAFIQIAEDEDMSIQSSAVTLSTDDVMTFTIFPKNQDETLCVITWCQNYHNFATSGA